MFHIKKLIFKFMLLLITKYNLSPKWVQIIIFILFYFISINLHFFDIGNNLMECMPKKDEYLILKHSPPANGYLTTKHLPENYPIRKYMFEGVRVTPEGKIIQSGQIGGNHCLNRIMDVVSKHHDMLKPLVAESKSHSIGASEILSHSDEVKNTVLEPIIANPSDFVSIERFQNLEHEVKGHTKLLTVLKEQTENKNSASVDNDFLNTFSNISNSSNQNILKETVNDVLRENVRLNSMFTKEQAEVASKINLLEQRLIFLENKNNEFLQVFKEIKEINNFKEARQIIDQAIIFEQPSRTNNFSSIVKQSEPRSKCCFCWF